MTYEIVTGFEHGWINIVPAAYKSGNCSISSVDSHTGTYHLRVEHDGVSASVFNFPITENYSRCISAWVITATGSRIVFNSTSLSYADYLQFSGSTWDIYSNGFKRATGAVIISDPLQWHLIELYVSANIAGAVSIESFVDGLPNGTYASAGVHTAPFNPYNSLGFYAPGPSGAIYVDDVAIGDAYCGDVRCDLRQINGDSTPLQWMPYGTPADHYVHINEIPPDDMDYLYTLTNGYEDRFTLNNWNGTGKTPIAVVNWVRQGQGSGIAAGAYVNVETISGGAVNKTQFPSQNGFASSCDVVETDPDGGGAWSESSINASTCGVEAVIP